MSRLSFVLVLAAGLSTLLVPLPAGAQVDPSDMVSGTVRMNNNPGTYNTTLYTVPSDKRLVLTDFNYSYIQINSTNTVTSVLTLRQGATDRWVWRTLQSVNPAIAVWPVEKHFETGIVFAPGTNVVLNQVLGGNQATEWSASWSGYLAPTTLSDAGEAPEARRGLALDAGPNPTGAGSTIRFRLDRERRVVLAVFDVQGRCIRTLREGTMPAGFHSVRWDGAGDDGKPVADGTYFARIETGGESEVEKITRLAE
jgi:hypothetical protein